MPMKIFKYLYFNPLVNKLNQNLGIRQKTYLAFIFVTLFFFIFLIIQLISFGKLSRANQEMEKLIRLHYFSEKIDNYVQEENIDVFSAAVSGNGQMVNLAEGKGHLEYAEDSLVYAMEEVSVPGLKKMKWINAFKDDISNFSHLASLYFTRQRGAGSNNMLSAATRETKNFAGSFTASLQNIRNSLLVLNDGIISRQKALVQSRERIISRMHWQSIVLFGLGLLVAVVIANFVAYKITDPIEKLQANIDVLSSGEYNFSQSFDVLDNDEIGGIVKGIERLGETMKQTIIFAEEVGRNNFDSKVQFEKKGKLANALLTMRDNLKEMTEQTKKQQEEEERRSNVMQQLTDLTIILRNTTGQLSDFYSKILQHLVKSVKGIQGGLFLVKEEDGTEPVLELRAAFAYDRQKYLHKEFLFGEGVIGRCALERERILMTDLPADYMKITSGLGQAEPSNLILIPMLLNDELYGVIEISSFKTFDNYHIDFLEKAAENIASTVHNVRINEQTASLFEKTRIQAEELASQEEEMKQNLEELQATQEEASRKSDELSRLLVLSREREKELEEKLGKANNEIKNLRKSR